MSAPQFSVLPLFSFIKYDRWWTESVLHGADYFIIHFVGAEFVRDFGPWRAGHKPAGLEFDFMRGSLREHNDLDPDNGRKTLNEVEVDFTEANIVAKNGERIAETRYWGAQRK